jgi:hypothetical protein
MEFEHEKFGKCELVELTQKKLEDFHRIMSGKGNEPLTVWRGDSVRACLKLGLLIDPKWKPEDVDNASPAHVYWLSERITEWQAEALKIDPLS